MASESDDDDDLPDIMYSDGNEIVDREQQNNAAMEVDSSNRPPTAERENYIASMEKTIKDLQKQLEMNTPGTSSSMNNSDDYTSENDNDSEENSYMEDEEDGEYDFYQKHYQNDDNSDSSDSDYEENSEEDNEPKKEPEFVTRRINPVTNYTELKPMRGTVWYPQLPKGKTVTWLKINKTTRITCSFCEKDIQIHEKIWHVISHTGGQKCAKCFAVFFNLSSKCNYNCKPKTAMYAITSKSILKNGKSKKKFYAKIRDGHPEYSVYALPLIKNSTKEEVWWVGSGMRSAYNNSKNQIRQSEKAKKTNFIHPKTGKATGCPSYNKMVYHKDPKQRWTPLPQRAKTLPLLGGINHTIQTLRNLIRIVLDTPGHHKAIHCEKIFKRHMTTILTKLQLMQDMPHYYKI